MNRARQPHTLSPFPQTPSLLIPGDSTATTFNMRFSIFNVAIPFLAIGAGIQAAPTPQLFPAGLPFGAGGGEFYTFCKAFHATT